jgi:hypothetical protein
MPKHPTMLTSVPCGATGLLMYIGAVGQCTITVERHGFDEERISRYGGVVRVLNFGYPVKACGHCNCKRLNVDVPGHENGWNGRNPIRGDYCSEHCRWAAKQDRYRARQSQYAGFHAPHSYVGGRKRP